MAVRVTVTVLRLLVKKQMSDRHLIDMLSLKEEFALCPSIGQCMMLVGQMFFDQNAWNQKKKRALSLEQNVA